MASVKNASNLLKVSALFSIQMRDKSAVEKPGYRLVKITLDKNGKAVNYAIEYVLYALSFQYLLLPVAMLT